MCQLLLEEDKSQLEQHVVKVFPPPNPAAITPPPECRFEQWSDWTLDFWITSWRLNISFTAHFWWRGDAFSIRHPPTRRADSLRMLAATRASAECAYALSLAAAAACVCVCAFVRPPLPLCPVSELVWMTYAEGQRRPHGPFPWAGSSPGRHSLTHSVKCNQPNVPPNDHDTLSNATMPNGIWLKTGHDWLGGILA